MHPLSQDRYENGVLAIALAVTALCLFAPLAAIGAYAEGINLSGAAGATVGIAVIFRATARRLLRASFQNILRTTFGTVSRAVARTATRRLVRVFAGSSIAAIAKQSSAGAAPDDTADSDTSTARAPARSFIALAIGLVGLSLSFWGVLLLANEEVAGLSTLQASLLAGLPIVVHGLVTYSAAKACGVQVHFVTSLDGLLIQGYFTGAGSFLPMTTDINYRGDNLPKARLATTALASLLAIHWLLHALAAQTASPEAAFASAMFLIYGFVYSFPISPLEGSEIWRVSKLWWLAVFVPILGSFLTLFPNDLAGLL